MNFITYMLQSKLTNYEHVKSIMPIIHKVGILSNIKKYITEILYGLFGQTNQVVLGTNSAFQWCSWTYCSCMNLQNHKIVPHKFCYAIQIMSRMVTFMLSTMTVSICNAYHTISTTTYFHRSQQWIINHSINNFSPSQEGQDKK